MKQKLKYLVLPTILFLLACSLWTTSCSGDDDDNTLDDDDDNNDDSSTASMFTKGIVASYIEEPNANFIKNYRLYNQHYFFYTTLDSAGNEDKLMEYKFGQISETTGEIDSESKTVAIFDNFGLTGYTVADTTENYCTNSAHILLKSDLNEMAHLDVANEDIFVLGNYNAGFLWVQDCNEYEHGQALLLRGGVLRSGEVMTVTEIMQADLWDYNPSREPKWVQLEEPFSEIEGGSDILQGATDLYFAPYQKDYWAGSAFIFIDSDGRLRYVYSKWDRNTHENQKLYEYPDAFSGFNSLGNIAQNFDIYYESIGLELFSLINQPENSTSPKHICIVTSDEKDENHKLWVGQGGNFDFYDWEFDIDYPGTCAITRFSTADSTTYTAYFPWVTYHSAKNELSVKWLDQKKGTWQETVVDSVPQTNWNFASKLNTMNLGPGTGTPLMIYYDDNDTIKVAVCNDHGRCGNNQD